MIEVLGDSNESAVSTGSGDDLVMTDVVQWCCMATVTVV